MNPPAKQHMDDRPRDDHGQFKREHSDEEFIEAVREHEPASTREVAEEIGIYRQSADYRLRRLEEDERVTRKKAGHSLVWMLANGGDPDE